MNDLTLKARLADADPNMIEKYGLTAAAGGNLRERFIPGYANKRYGKAGVQQANQNAATGAQSVQTNTQDANRLALQQRQAGAGKPVSNFNPAEKRTLGRQNAGQHSDKQNMANMQVAANVAQYGSPNVAEKRPIVPMGAGSNGTATPDTSKTTTEVKNGLDGASEIRETTIHSNEEPPQNTETGGGAPPSPESGVVPEVPPTGGTPPTTNVPPPPTGGTPPPPPPPPPTTGATPPPTGATPPPAGGGGLQVDAQVGTNNNRNQASVGPMSFNFGNMGGGGQAQPQQQQQQQMTPQQQAKAAQIANANKRANTSGGLATNPLLGVATMGLSNVAGAAYNAYQRNQGNKQLQQLSKMLLMRKSIGMRNTTGALRRGRI